MRKNSWQRRLAMLSVIVLLISQFTQSASIVFAQVERSLFEIEATPDSTTDEAEIQLENHSLEDYDSIEIALPEAVTFNKELTDEISQNDVSINYDKEAHEISFAWKEEAKQTARFILNDLPSTENELIITGLKEDSEEQEIHKFLVSDVIVETEVEETIEVEEPEKVEEVNESETNTEIESFTKAEDQKAEETTKSEDPDKEVPSGSSNKQQPEDDNGKKENTKKDINADKGESVGITPYAGDINTDIDISANNKEIEAGRTAVYNIVFKATGAKKEYTNAKIVVDLPIHDYTEFNQDLGELEIAGIQPVYDSENGTLIYEFDKLKTGQTYEVRLKIDTKNGISPNGASLDTKVSFEAEEMSKVTDDATVKIKASNSIVLDKRFVEARQGGNTKPVPFPGSYTIWDIKVNVPKKELGQMYLKENSKIIVKDTFPNSLEFYDVMDGTPQPKQSGNTLTWEFDAPSIEEQMKADGDLFTMNLRVRLYVPNNKSLAGTIVNNEASVTMTFIDEEKIDPPIKTNAEVGIFESDPSNGEMTGNVIYPRHIGPSDGNGNTTTDPLNSNPKVFDDAYLTFEHGITSMLPGRDYDLKEYRTDYKIDPNLIFEGIHTPGNFRFARNQNEFNLKIPLAKQPEFNIVAVIKGEDSPRILIRNAKHNHTYTRSDLGLLPTDRVDEIRLNFTYAPMGMHHGNRVKYHFTVKEGFVGQVENDFDVRILPNENANVTTNNNGVWWYKQHNETTWGNLASDRNATILPYPPDRHPIATVGVKLLDHNNNIVSLGENVLEISLRNENSSTVNMLRDLESVVLLPLGVTVASNPNPLFNHGTNYASINGKFEVLEDDYNGSGRQLVKVKWDKTILEPNRTIRANINVDINEHAPSSLKFDVYGFSGNKKLGIPSVSNESITNTSLETDADDLNADGDKSQPRLKSGNIYTLTSKYDLQIEKFVKGNDDEWSKLAEITQGKEYSYKLNLKNSTGRDITKMVLMDVLPSNDDLGITDNVQRGSKFTPELTGPLSIPEAWENKVDVYYSESKNPKRDDLVENTIYPETTEKISNPEGAEDPNWQSESAIDDWSKINSFKVVLKDDQEFIKGDSVDILFNMVVPKICELDASLLDSNVEPSERAAWNSFAVATEHGQPVEPERVGVYMNATGAVELTKVDENDETLEGAIFELYRTGETEAIGEYTSDENGKIKVEDLDFGEYYFVETEAPEGYELDDTPIKFTVDKLFKDTDGNELDCSELVEIRKINKQIPTEPEIEKDVEGTDHISIDYEKEYNYNVITKLPSDIEDYEKFIITDNVDEGLEVIGDRVTVTVDGEPYEGIKLTVDGNHVKVEVKDFAGLSGKDQIELVIPAKIKEETREAIEKGEYADNKIPNTATLDFTNSSGVEDQKETEPVTVTPPPDITKDVEGTDHITVDYEKEYTYNVITTLPSDIKDYEKFIITDNVDGGLEVIGDHVTVTVDGEPYEGIELTVDGNHVKVEVKDFTGLSGKDQIELVIPAKIKEETREAIENGKYPDNKIPNTATLDFTNSSGVEDQRETKPVTVTPPPTPEIEKDIDGVKAADPVEKLKGEAYEYNITTNIPANVEGYETITISDDLDKRLEVVGAKVLVDGEETDGLEAQIEGQLVTVTLDADQLQEVAGKEVKLVITAKINEDVAIEVIDNQASIQVNDNPKVDSNIVPVIPKDPPTEPEIEKDVEGKDHISIDYEKEYTYNVITKLPSDIEDYEKFIITDNVDEGLEVIGDHVTVTVDGEPYEGIELTVDGNHVKVEVKDFAGLSGKDQIELVIPVKIKEETREAIENGEYADNKIPNTATLDFTNSSGVEDKRETKPVTVTPPPTPEIEKDIDGVKAADPVEKLKGEAYEYNITTNIPANVEGYETITISDDLDKRLEVVGAKVLVDGEETDGLEAQIEGQLVTVTLDADQLQEVAGKEVKLVITAKINEDVAIEVIDNQASIQVNDNPKVDSNIVPVIPKDPPTEPEIEKDVEGKDHISVDYEKEYTYNVITKLPSDIEDYEKFIITDNVDKGLEVIGDHVTVTVDGEPYDGIELTVDGNHVKVEVKDFTGLSGKDQVELVIPAKIKEETREAIENGEYPDNKIPNTATLDFTNSSGVEDQKETEPVTVTPPPDITKDVEGMDHISVDYEKEYTYNVITTLPSDIEDYEKFIITDNVDKGLEVIGDHVTVTVDGEPYEGIELTVDGNHVKVEVKDFTGLSGKDQIELVIPVKIKEETREAIENGEYADNKIPNTATLDFTNSSGVEDKRETKPVTVTPPPTPEIEKDIDGVKAADPVEKLKGEAYEYNITTNIPANVEGYETVTISDDLDERLEVVGAKVLVDGEETDGLEAQIEGQLVTVTLDADQLQTVAGKEVKLVITAKINDDVAIEVIDNQASIQVNDNPKVDSNIVPVMPKDPPTEPEIEKDVEGKDHISIDYEKEYTYNVITKLPSDIEDYEKFIITDNVDEGLEVIGDHVTVTVDGEPYKGIELTVDGNHVKVEVKDFAGLSGKDQIELVIPAKIKEETREAIENGEYPDNKIPNTATLDFTNSSGVEDKKETEPVTVTPPPDITKDVEGKDHITVDYEKEYTYNVITTLPSDIEDYEKFIITDNVDEGLEVIGDHVTVTVDGEPYEGIELTVDGNHVKVEVKDFTGLSGKDQIELVIPVKIKEETREAIENGEYADNKIPNTATLDFTNSSGVEDQRETKPVTVTPPPTPEIEKDIDGVKAADPVEKLKGEAYEYNITTNIPANVEGYETVTISDDLDKRLEVVGAKVLVDGEETDGLEAQIEGQLVIVTLDADQLQTVAGKEVKLVITAKINEDVAIEVIDNQASIQVNDNPKVDSNIVPVIPKDPPTEPEIEKDVEGKDHISVDYEKEYTYNVITKLPSDIEDYEKFIITDNVDKGLEVIGDHVTVTVDGEPYDGIELTVDGNHVKVEVKDFTGLSGKDQVELVIPAKIKEETRQAIENGEYPDNKIPNTATLDFTNSSGKEDKKETEPVTVTPPPVHPGDPPKEDPEDPPAPPVDPGDPPKKDPEDPPAPPVDPEDPPKEDPKDPPAPPVDPEDPPKEDPEDPSIPPVDPKDPPKLDKPGEQLPKTATNIFNSLLAGAVLLLLGVLAAVTQRRRREN